MHTTKSDLEFLIKLQKELRTQDTDCQAAPRYWVIADDEMVPVPEGYHSEYYIYSSASDGMESLDDLLESLKNDMDYMDDPEAAKADYARINHGIEAIDWLRKYWCEDAELIPVTQEHRACPNTMFLTKAEAQKHLRLNHYNYSPRAHTFAMTAQRAPVVERLLKILATFDWKALEDALATMQLFEKIIAKGQKNG